MGSNIENKIAYNNFKRHLQDTFCTVCRHGPVVITYKGKPAFILREHEGESEHGRPFIEKSDISPDAVTLTRFFNGRTALNIKLNIGGEQKVAAVLELIKPE